MKILEKFGYAIGGFAVGVFCIGCAAYFTAFTSLFGFGAVCAVVLGACAHILSQPSR